MVLFHQLIISPVSQMHAFSSCSLGRNPVPTQATIKIWLKDLSLQHILLCGCFKKKRKKQRKKGKISPVFWRVTAWRTINEENHWRSLWQKRRMSQMKAGPPMHQPVCGGGGGCGAERVREETASSVWLYWNLEPLATEARQEVRLVSTSKAWLLTRFPSKEHQTFISSKCLPSSVWLWSVLLCSGSLSSVPCWMGTFAKDKIILYFTHIIPICCFSQHWGNFQLRLCLFPSWQRGPSTVHSTWDSFLKGESHIGYSAVGSAACFQELHSSKSSFALLMCVWEGGKEALWGQGGQARNITPFKCRGSFSAFSTLPPASC